MPTLSKTVTLSPGQSRQVSFQVVPKEVGIYGVSVDGLTGSFRAIPPTEARVASIIWTGESDAIGLEYWFNLPTVRLILPTPAEAISVISSPNIEFIELVAHGPTATHLTIVGTAMAKRPNPYRFALAYMCEGQTPEGGVATTLLKGIKSGNVGLGMRGIESYFGPPCQSPFKPFIRYFCGGGSHPPNLQAGFKAGEAWEAALDEVMKAASGSGWTWEEGMERLRWHYIFWGDPEVRAVDMV